MIRLVDEVLPENRKRVIEYIWYAWADATTFTRSIKWEESTDELRAKFQTHVDAEEERLRKNFEDVKYDIDSYDSVPLISGHGRIETVWSLTLSCAQLSPANRLCSRCYTFSSREIYRRLALLASTSFQIPSSATLWAQSSGSPAPLGTGCMI